MEVRGESERASARERERVSPGMEKLGRAKRIFFCADFAVEKKTRLQMVVDFLVIGGFDDVRGV